jgi:hypothetical protein
MLRTSGSAEVPIVYLEIEPIAPRESGRNSIRSPATRRARFRAAVLWLAAVAAVIAIVAIGAVLV